MLTHVNFFRYSKRKIDLKYLIRQAEELGALYARAIKTRDIVIDERTYFKCLVPRCPWYNVSPMCPPSMMKPSEFQKILSKYADAILIQITDDNISNTVKEKKGKVSSLTEMFQSDDYVQSFVPGMRKLHAIIEKIEAMAFNRGYRFAAGLICGTCLLCDDCVKRTPPKICKLPFKARPSMEAVGIDVQKTAERAGLIFDMSDENRKVTSNGLVLID